MTHSLSPSRSQRSRAFAAALALALVVSPSLARAQSFDLDASSFVGGGGDDAIRGARVLADGTVVVVGTLAAGVPAGVPPTLLFGATEDSPGAVLRLSHDGRRVLSVTRIARRVGPRHRRA